MEIKVILTTLLLSAVVLSGCVDSEPDAEAVKNQAIQTALEDGVTSLSEREGLSFDVTDGRSHTLNVGQYEIAEPRSIFVDVNLPETEGGQANNPADGPKVHLGLFLPVIEGCDWDAAELPAECNVPIIADVGPYYSTPGDVLADNDPTCFVVCNFGEPDVPADERASVRLGEFLISRFVPHGYGVAQVSVFGTGQSNHCFDAFGLGEQLGVKGAVDWLGSQPFSNEKVGLIGRSYDGSTPWMAAAHPSQYLATIVPISGLTGLGDLVQWNGASESRAVTFQNVVYRGYGFDGHEAPTDAANQASCADWTTGAGWGGASYATGDDVVDEENTFWAERHFLPRVIENYEGSIYIQHGLLDDNVDPQAGWQGELMLRELGFDVRSMWGQWYHNYPDRVSEHGIAYNEDGELVELANVNSIRMDYAQDLLEWFNFYLKGEGAQPDLHAEIQQMDGAWRVEPVWPPAGADFLHLETPGTTVTVSSGEDPVTIDLGVLSATDDTLLGGFSSVTFTVTPSGPGGQIYVELRDGTDDIDFGLSYGIMNLRYADGEPTEVTPGEPMEVTIPFQNFDAVLPAGHTLALYVSETGNDYLQGAVQDPSEIDLAGSMLHLSTLDRDDSFYYTPPMWWVEDAEGNVIGQVEN
jgi:putative CocE/NonD family hydrolase